MKSLHTAVTNDLL